MQKKEAIQTAVTGALVLILVFFVLRAVRRVERVRQPPKPPPAAADAAVVAQGSGDSGFFARMEAETKNLEWKRDPFTDNSLAALHECPAGLCLKGIVWSADNPGAIINDRIVRVGDKIQGEAAVAVIEINEKEVVLSDGPNLIRLHLD